VLEKVVGAEMSVLPELEYIVLNDVLIGIHVSSGLSGLVFLARP
jgi:hypothetical protein